MRLFRQREVDDARGAAAVEFALIFPILVLLILGIVEFGFVFNTQISMTQAVREGIRYEALETGDAEEEAAAAFHAIGVDHDSFDPTLEQDCDDDDEDRAILTATLPYSPMVLFVIDDLDINARAVMRCGG